MYERCGVEYDNKSDKGVRGYWFTQGLPKPCRLVKIY